MNFFRIPLNLLVIVILKWVDSFEWTQIFVICGVWLLVGTILLVSLGVLKKREMVISGQSNWAINEV